MLHLFLLRLPSIITKFLSDLSTTTPIFPASLPEVFTTNLPTSIMNLKAKDKAYKVFCSKDENWWFLMNREDTEGITKAVMHDGLEFKILRDETSGHFTALLGERAKTMSFDSARYAVMGPNLDRAIAKLSCLYRHVEFRSESEDGKPINMLPFENQNPVGRWVLAGHAIVGQKSDDHRFWLAAVERGGKVENYAKGIDFLSSYGGLNVSLRKFGIKT